MSAEKYNLRNPAVKRIVQELKEIQRDDNPDILAEVLEENLFEWHFVIRGAWDTEFERGIYHGRILMPADYPFKPPAFVMLTPSGRFETGTKICLSISSYHPESWQPSWSVRSALVALIAFMQTPGSGAVGSLDHSAEVRREMAAEARGTPPKHGTPERQAVIDEMHQRMLDMEDRSEALYRRTEPAQAEAAAQPAAAEVEAPASPATDSAAPVASAAAAGSEAAALGQDAEPSAAQLEERPLGAAAETVSTPALPTLPATPSLAPSVASSPAPLPLAASPPSPTPVPLPALQPAGPAPLIAVGAESESWEDRSLTYLAWLLLVVILAVVLRRACASLLLEPSDDVFSVSPVADVEL